MTGRDPFVWLAVPIMVLSLSACQTHTPLSLSPEATALQVRPVNIVVSDFASSGNAVVPEGIVKSCTAYILSELRKARDIGAAAVVKKGSRVPGEGIEIQGTYTRFTEGSPLLRLLIGGLGKARLEGEVRLVDLNTRKTLGTSMVKTSTTWSGIIGALTSAEDLARPFAQEVAKLVREYKLAIHIN